MAAVFGLRNKINLVAFSHASDIDLGEGLPVVPPEHEAGKQFRSTETT